MTPRHLPTRKDVDRFRRHKRYGINLGDYCQRWRVKYREMRVMVDNEKEGER